MNIYICLILGLVAGVASGFLGIGGGVILVPALVYIFGFTQHQAQGTTLALMIPPIGLLAAMKYYQAGNVDVKVAGLICMGFIVGGLLGATFAAPVPDFVLKKIFGVFLILVALKMILSK